MRPRDARMVSFPPYGCNSCKSLNKGVRDNIVPSIFSRSVVPVSKVSRGFPPGAVMISKCFQAMAEKTLGDR